MATTKSLGHNTPHPQTQYTQFIFLFCVYCIFQFFVSLGLNSCKILVLDTEECQRGASKYGASGRAENFFQRERENKYVEYIYTQKQHIAHFSCIQIMVKEHERWLCPELVGYCEKNEQC